MNGKRLSEEERERRLLGLLYANDTVPCGESEESLRGMIGGVFDVCKRRDLKVNVRVTAWICDGGIGISVRSKNNYGGTSRGYGEWEKRYGWYMVPCETLGLTT